MRYDSDSKCPKCANDWVTSQYVPQGDYIRRVCQRCGYFWYDDTLDKERENERETTRHGGYMWP